MSDNPKPSAIRFATVQTWCIRLSILGIMGLMNSQPARAKVIGGSQFSQRSILQTNVQTTHISQVVATSSETVLRPILKSGSQGTEVSELQSTLKLLGFYSGTVDGMYGQGTIAAVSQFQQAAGLTPDGVVGPATWDRLFPPAPASSSSSNSAAAFPGPSAANPNSSTNSTPPASSGPKPTPAKSNSASASPRPTAANTDSVTLPILKPGMRGPAVEGLQVRLQTIGIYKGAVDGVFGPETQAAVKAAQRTWGLDPDGIVGPSTWTALLRSSK